MRPSQCEIELLCEYRIRLIADLVNGRFDVRETAVSPERKSSMTVGGS